MLSSVLRGLQPRSLTIRILNPKGRYTRKCLREVSVFFYDSSPNLSLYILIIKILWQIKERMKSKLKVMLIL